MNRIVDNNGYKVIAIAGTAGSGKIFDTITNEMKVPMFNTIDMYRKFVKWACEKSPKTPHCVSASKVHPLKKKAENIIKKQVKRLFKKSNKYGG